ncbi:MAG: fibronectin type III domain-containing protein [Bacteroidia bacterium]|nr:fibronectin type III domain-containing protein [Bacteroidia bacterium]
MLFVPLLSLWGQNLEEEIRVCTTCPMPTGFSVAEVTDSSVTLRWNLVPGVNCYYLQYRLEEEANWRTVIACGNYYTLRNISPCALYEARIASVFQTLHNSTHNNKRQSTILVISPISAPIFFRTRLPRLKNPVVATTFLRTNNRTSVNILNICPGDTTTLQAIIEPGKCFVQAINWYRYERQPNQKWGNKMLLPPCPSGNSPCHQNGLLKNVRGEAQGKNILYEAEAIFYCPCGNSIETERLSGGINLVCCTACP